MNAIRLGLSKQFRLVSLRPHIHTRRAEVINLSLFPSSRPCYHAQAPSASWNGTWRSPSTISKLRWPTEEGFEWWTLEIFLWLVSLLRSASEYSDLDMAVANLTRRPPSCSMLISVR